MINTLMILERVDGLRSFIVPFEPYISFADLCLKMPNADILFCFLLLVFMIPFHFPLHLNLPDTPVSPVFRFLT